VVQGGTYFVKLPLAQIKLAGEIGNLLLQRFYILTGGFDLADFLRSLVTPALQFLHLGLQLLSAGFQRRELFHVEVVATARQSGCHLFEIVTQQLRIEHCVS